jgi:hypothetical protein
MFPGSNHVYIKYHDILGTPRFTILQRLLTKKFHPGLYDVSFLDGKKHSELIHWYMNRKHENFLNDPLINMNTFTPDENDRIMQSFLKLVGYTSFIPVLLMDAFIVHPIVDHLHIYSKTREPGIESYLGRYTSHMSDVNYLTGDIEKITIDARDQCTIVTNSSEDIRKFADPRYPNRYFIYIQPNHYDPIESLSDIYANFSNRFTVIDVNNRLKVWEDLLNESNHSNTQ